MLYISDVDLAALGEILARDLGLAAEADDLVPLGLLLAVAVTVAPPAVGGEGRPPPGRVLGNCEAPGLNQSGIEGRCPAPVPIEF